MKNHIRNILSEIPENATSIKMHLKSNPNTLALVRKVITASVQHLGLATDIIEGVKLATTEACTNVIKHSYKFDESKSFEMKLKSCSTVFVVELFYNDPGFEPYMIPKRNLKEIKEGGYGVFLMQSIMDHVGYTTDAKTGNVHLIMVKLLAPSREGG